MIVFGLECSRYWSGQLRRCDAFDLVIRTGRVLCVWYLSYFKSMPVASLKSMSELHLRDSSANSPQRAWAVGKTERKETAKRGETESGGGFTLRTAVITRCHCLNPNVVQLR